LVKDPTSCSDPVLWQESLEPLSPLSVLMAFTCKPSSKLMPLSESCSTWQSSSSSAAAVLCRGCWSSWYPDNRKAQRGREV